MFTLTDESSCNRELQFEHIDTGLKTHGKSWDYMCLLNFTHFHWLSLMIEKETSHAVKRQQRLNRMSFPLTLSSLEMSPNLINLTFTRLY